MTAILGKRKRRAELNNKDVQPNSQADDQRQDDSVHLQALLRKHFEATYEPLDVGPSASEQVDESSSASGLEEDEDWNGISDGEDHTAVEVVEHGAVLPTDAETDKEERKLFMSPKPPASTSNTKPRKTKPPEEAEDPSTEASLRKNDLELQRLLRESHLLSGSSSDNLSVSGKVRHKALDLRLQALGSKKSLSDQKNMPMAHRRGIQGKRQMKEETRRSEARENGVILEKEQKQAKKAGRRERGVGTPAVGRFKGGTLQLSRKDVRDIQGPSTAGGKGRKGGKRR